MLAVPSGTWSFVCLLCLVWQRSALRAVRVAPVPKAGESHWQYFPPWCIEQKSKAGQQELPEQNTHRMGSESCARAASIVASSAFHGTARTVWLSKLPHHRVRRMREKTSDPSVAGETQVLHNEEEHRE